MVLGVPIGVSPMSLAAYRSVTAHTSPNMSGADATNMQPLTPKTPIPDTVVSPSWIIDHSRHIAALTPPRGVP